MYYEFKPTTVKNKNWLHEILESWVQANNS
jgi:hypothetical protein